MQKSEVGVTDQVLVHSLYNRLSFLLVGNQRLILEVVQLKLGYELAISFNFSWISPWTGVMNHTI